MPYWVTNFLAVVIAEPPAPIVREVARVMEEVKSSPLAEALVSFAAPVFIVVGVLAIASMGYLVVINRKKIVISIAESPKRIVASMAAASVKLNVTLLQSYRLITNGTLFSIPPPHKDFAISAAKQRAQFLADVTKYDRPTDYPRFRIRESRSGSRDLTEPLSLLASIAQMAELRWQASSDPVLLLGRATDTLDELSLDLYRIGSALWKDLYSSVRIAPIGRLTKFISVFYPIFPWVLIVETHHDEILLRQKELLSSRIGLGIEFRKPSSAEFLAGCEAGGRTGKIGGGLKFYDGEYGVTCEHVISKTCSCSFISGSPSENSAEPDAAILLRKNGCFGNEPARLMSVNAVSEEKDEFTLGKLVQFAGKHENSLRGRIDEIGKAYLCENRIFKFPFFVVVPKSSTIPIWDRVFRAQQFSRPGDSGAWVVLADYPHQWIGMVACGNSRRHSSNVLHAGVLMRFFRDAVIVTFGGAFENTLQLEAFVEETRL